MPGAGLVGSRTRRMVAPGPLNDDVASYQMTPSSSVNGLSTVSPAAPAYVASANQAVRTTKPICLQRTFSAIDASLHLRQLVLDPMRSATGSGDRGVPLDWGR